MNFSQKVTARNIFRYKKRAIITIVGIAGCTGLMLTGFGIRDSVQDIPNFQYREIYQYDSAISLLNTNRNRKNKGMFKTERRSNRLSRSICRNR